MSKQRKQKTRKWAKAHADDPYVQQARKEGYRSRAVYKLKEIDGRDHLIKSGMTVLELGAAPGGWSQYVSEKVGKKGRIFALDILPMETVEGVDFIQGDFTENSFLEQVLEVLGSERVDLVLSDMAPNISGIRSSDQARAIYLGELAVEMARRVLKPGANLLMKSFEGEGTEGLRKQVKEHFKMLVTRNPQASRAKSREIYMLAKGLRNHGNDEENNALY